MAQETPAAFAWQDWDWRPLARLVVWGLLAAALGRGGDVPPLAVRRPPRTSPRRSAPSLCSSLGRSSFGARRKWATASRRSLGRSCGDHELAGRAAGPPPPAGHPPGRG